MRRPARVLAALAAISVLGCLPEKRIRWSRDGSRALVKAGQGRLLLLEGPELAARSLDICVADADWVSDRQIVVAQIIECGRWADLAARLTEPERGQVSAVAARLTDAFMKHQGPIDQFDPGAALGPEATPYLPAALLYVRENPPPGLREKAGQKWEELKKGTAKIHVLAVLEPGPGPLEGPTELAHFLSEGPVRVVAEPGGRAVAVLVSQPALALSDTEPGFALLLCDPGRPGWMKALDERVGYDAAWSADGRRLAYMRYVGGPPVRSARKDELTRLAEVIVARIAYDESGRIAERDPEQARPVGLLYHGFSAIQFAGDDSLLLAAAEMRLPSTAADAPGGWSVFRHDPRFPAAVADVLGSQGRSWFAKPHPLAWFFALDPAGRRLLLLGGEEQDNGRLYITDLLSESREVVEHLHADQLGVWPTWRNEREFAAVVRPGAEGVSGHRSELVLFRLNDAGKPEPARVLSRDWPDEWVQGWLEVKPEDGSPATKPAGTDMETPR